PNPSVLARGRATQAGSGGSWPSAFGYFGIYPGGGPWGRHRRGAARAMRAGPRRTLPPGIWCADQRPAQQTGPSVLLQKRLRRLFTFRGPWADLSRIPEEGFTGLSAMAALGPVPEGIRAVKHYRAYQLRPSLIKVLAP